jgi:hypothetical protein
MSRIRLSCRFCDRNDYDGINVLPPDWFAVDEVQTYEQSIRPADPADSSNSVLDWYTHLGVCPECQELEFGPIERSA